MPPDLVLPACEWLTRNQGIVKAMGHFPAPCGARHPFTVACGIISSSRGVGQGPAPFDPVLVCGRPFKTPMDQCQVSFLDGFFGELYAKEGERFGITGQYHNAAGVSVDAMDGMNGGKIARLIAGRRPARTAASASEHRSRPGSL